MIRIPCPGAGRLHGKMLLQVHDELVIECPRAELARVAGVVRDIMENAYPLSIPLTTEARLGQRTGMNYNPGLRHHRKRIWQT